MSHKGKRRYKQQYQVIEDLSDFTSNTKIFFWKNIHLFFQKINNQLSRDPLLVSAFLLHTCLLVGLGWFVSQLAYAFFLSQAITARDGFKMMVSCFRYYVNVSHSIRRSSIQYNKKAKAKHIKRLTWLHCLPSTTIIGCKNGLYVTPHYLLQHFYFIDMKLLHTSFNKFPLLNQ